MRGEIPLATPTPEGHVEGTAMTPEQMREWFLAMPPDEQLQFMTDVREGLDLAALCMQADHHGRLANYDVKRAIGSGNYQTFSKLEQAKIEAWLQVRGLEIGKTEVMIEQQDGRVRVLHWIQPGFREISYFDGPLPV
jgi:hypothetical protein